MPYKMPNGKYRAHKMIDGRRKTKVFERLAEAKKWEAEQSEASWIEAETPTVTVCELANRYLDDVKANMSEKTYQEKILAFRRLYAVVDKSSTVEAITVAQARAVMRLASEASTPNEANKARKNLAAAWEWGRGEMALPEANPFRAVKKLRADKTARYVPSVAHMDKVLATETGEVRLFLMTMLHTAARRGELLRLQWGDLDFERKTIKLSTRKRTGGGLEHNVIPMTEALRAELLAARRQAKSVFVFCDDDGQPFKWRQHLMGRVCKRAGVKRFGFHAIRHLSASMLARAGLPIPTIQAILRHKNPMTTARYLRDLLGADAPLDEVFGGQGKKKALGVASSEG